MCRRQIHLDIQMVGLINEVSQMSDYLSLSVCLSVYLTNFIHTNRQVKEPHHWKLTEKHEAFGLIFQIFPPNEALFYHKTYKF